MMFRSAVAAAALTLAGMAVPVALVAGPAHADATVTVTSSGHACTRTSSGTCIQGGQFCPQASLGKSGGTAKGRRYVCKGDRTHPHWMKPYAARLGSSWLGPATRPGRREHLGSRPCPPGPAPRRTPGGASDGWTGSSTT